MTNIGTIYEKYGILTACLTDPLSQIISKILQLKDNESNAVGFYYTDEICHVILLNIYNSQPIHFVIDTMDLLLSSTFVNKIIYYPFNESSKRITESNSILSRKSIDKYDNKLQENFKNLVINIHTDYNQNCTSLLLKLVNINFPSNLITGYSLVNSVLSTFMEKSFVLEDLPNDNIISCYLLKSAVSISSPREIINDDDIKYILEESRQEIINLATNFMDLFANHELFHNKILAKKSLLAKNNIDHLADLGVHIKNIVDAFDSIENLTINLGKVITSYNNAIRGTQLNKINIHDTSCTISRTATIILPGEISPPPLNSHSIHIPMANANLKFASSNQLLDILIYIDSLRDTTGESDTRFANLQNEITHELSRRRK